MRVAANRAEPTGSDWVSVAAIDLSASISAAACKAKRGACSEGGGARARTREHGGCAGGHVRGRAGDWRDGALWPDLDRRLRGFAHAF